MDEYDEQEPEAASQAEPPTERVRIIGAEPAAVLAGDTAASEPGAGGPVDPEERYLGFVHDPARSSPPQTLWPEPAAGEVPEPAAGEAPEPPELPHWTEPPTGQVPAILDRRGEEDDDMPGGFADSGPVWREHEHEWEDDAGFQPAMLADHETRVGVLEEAPVEERRPWEFDDLSTGRVEAVAAEPEPPPWGEEPALDEADPGVTAGPGTEPAAAPTAGPSPWGEGPGDDSDSEPGGEATESLAPHPQPHSEPPALGLAPPPPPPVAAPPARPRARRRPAPASPDAPARRNVPVAVATGVGLAGVALGCFELGTVATVVLATIVVTLAAAECFAALRRAGMRPATLLGLVGTVAVMVSAYSKGVAALPLVLVLVVATSMIWYLVGAERGAPVEGISATVLGFAWIGLFGSFSALMLAPSIYPNRHGIAFLFGAVVATVGGDVGALVVGSWLGRHQLAPHVSPNKTWEGLVGGAVVAVVASALITGHVHPWTPGKAAILGLVAAVIAPVGDLCESLVKRDLGLKDMGSLLPGHGGILDRVDALLFVLPATYYLVRVLNLG